MAIAAGVSLAAAHSSRGRDHVLPRETLRIVALEDWGVRAGGSAVTGTVTEQARPPGRSGSLVGRVHLPDSSGVTVERPDASRLSAPQRRSRPEPLPAVVYLESLPDGAAGTPAPRRARIDQRDETFVPHVLAVTAGSVVDFPNSDRTYHNVFSLSRTKRFDLGRYAQGRSRAVRFDRAGVVRVFCDIHSHMSAYVLVFNHEFFATTDADGRYRIDGVPPGRYTVSAWHEGESRDTQTVTLPPSGGPIDLDFRVP